MNSTSHPEYRAEVARKLFHLVNFSIPVIYFFISKSTALSILFPLTFGFIVVDILRFYHKPTADLFYKFFGLLLRDHERDGHNKRLNGATFVLISATICILIFPKLFAVIGLVTLTFADSAAALIGARYGKRPFFGKSLEGSVAFLVVAIMVTLFTPKFEYMMGEYIIGVTAAVVGTFAEATSGIFDNLAIPLSIGTTLWVGYLLFYPEINVYYFDLL